MDHQNEFGAVPALVANSLPNSISLVELDVAKARAGGSVLSWKSLRNNVRNEN